ncbi:MAG TPA: peptide chain release factor N(5)-glutamine methyltransferase [Candidatus Limnocylindria bacterium]|nr:peptide chain release factor N(5)-glutamine methyltransferase [Candidatus Limnocylindria bacterium]
MPTWGGSRATATTLLRAAADPHTAALDADVLLAHVLGVAKETLLAHPERALSAAEQERYRGLVERRARGEPVAYLRGFKEFYGLRFRVDPRVLIPRPETETVVDAAREFIRGRPLVLVDVGTGSGAIAVAIAAHEHAVRVIATDSSRDALAVAEANALACGVADRVEFRAGDLLAPIVEQVDVVCANLPYLPEDSVERWVGERTSLAFEPREAVVAGPDGLAVVRRCIADLPRVLAVGGAAFFECDPPQAGPIAGLLSDAGFAIRTLRDLAGDERVVAGVRDAWTSGPEPRTVT